MLASFSAAGILAQSVGGVVTDQSGAVMPHVRIELRDAGRGLVRAAETDATGYYAISSVPAASYLFTANANLFLPFEMTQLKLEAGTSRRLDVVMKVDRKSVV